MRAIVAALAALGGLVIRDDGCGFDPGRPLGLGLTGLSDRLDTIRASALKDLTPRELDVLREMAQGRGNAGIAGQLFLRDAGLRG